MFHIQPVIYLIIIATIAGLWKIFEKAGEKGWKALVPVYNYYIWLKILKRPWWWIFIFLIPGVGFMMMMVISAITSQAFQKKKASDLVLSGLLFFIYLPYLGFGKLKFELPVETKKEKQSVVHEWLEAITFAVIAATIIRTFCFEAYTIPTSSMEKSLLVGDYLFVSKMNYGARIPMTPISFPFAHNALPLTKSTPSYLDWLEYPALRLPGFAKIKRHDVVVFNFPNGDTVPSIIDNPDYYSLCRMYGRDYVLQNKPIGNMGLPGHIMVRPLDKEENFIKRCIGTPGDTLKIRYAQVYINGKADEIPTEAEYGYAVTTNGSPYDDKLLEKLDITELVEPFSNIPNTYLFFMTRQNAERVKASMNVVSVTPYIQDTAAYEPEIFPNAGHYKWNVDNFGPLYIPKEGATIAIDTCNLHLYRRVINVYENNKLEVKGSQIFINDKLATSYTFKQNYYFMMGDNRHRSADSRYWGFVPDDHIVGKASFIWMSLKEGEPLSKKMRWDRFFTFVNSEGISKSYLMPCLLIFALALAYFFIKGKRKEKKA